MNISLTNDDYIKKLEFLNQEMAQLKITKAAFEAQKAILEKVVAMAYTPEQEEVLTVTLEEVLELCCKLTGAEKGSLFLLNENGIVTDSILTQKDTAKETRSNIIGSVLDKGLAGWVYRHRQIGLIKDTLEDDRWLMLPIQPYEARSALAVPIFKATNLVGILTILHSQPNCFNCETAELMQATANEIAIVVEIAALYGKLEDSYSFLDKAKQEAEAYSKALDYELEKGKQIQLDFLPSELPQLPGWDIAACFYPARQVAGDFYDAFTLPGGYVGLVIADVCDKGVGAALFMALFRSLIRLLSGQTLWYGSSVIEEDDCLAGLNEELLNNNLQQINALKAIGTINNYIAEQHAEMSMFATLFFGILDPETGYLVYVNGGHEPLYIIGPEGVKGTLNPTGPAVGMMPNMKFKVKRAFLCPGDTLIGYTDGVTEAHSPNRKLFTPQRLLSLLQKIPNTPNELLEIIKAELFIFMDNAPQFDDITMIAVKRNEVMTDG